MNSVAIGLSILAAYAAFRVSFVHFLGPDPASVFSSLPDFQHVDIGLKDTQEALQRFSKALSFQTVSNSTQDNHVESSDSFAGLQFHLEHSFPLVHAKLQVEKASAHSARNGSADAT